MAEDNELEKRAVEELLRETDRARVRAETMGPAGWMKCPLRSTNKRFLFNTLRSTRLQQRPSEPRDVHSTTRGHLNSETGDRSHERSRSPPRDSRSNGDHTDHKTHHRDSWNKKDKKEDRDKERNSRHRDRDRRHGDNGQKRQ